MLFFEQGSRGSRREHVGHVHEGSDSTCRSGTAAFSNVAFVSQSRFAKMHLVVDDTGKHITAFGMNDFAAFGGGFGQDGSDAVAVDNKVGFELLVFVDEDSSLDYFLHGDGF